MHPPPSTDLYAEARQRAQVLRQQAIDEAFATLVGWLRRAFARRPAASTRTEVQPCHS